MSKRSIFVEEDLRKETLYGIQSSGDRAHSIWNNVLIIIEDNKIIASEKAAGTPSPKLVARYNEIIANCKHSIKENMKKLGADEASINKLMDFVNNGDMYAAQIHMLKLLVKRNPGMYSRKLAACQAKVK